MTSDDRSFLNWVATALALAALVLGFFALGRVGTSNEQAAGVGGGSGETSVVELELGALVLSPRHIMAPPGEVTVRVTNTDSQVHNISIMGVKSRDLQPGESQDLQLGVLDVGVYPMLCEIPGHDAAGMNGNLHVIVNAEPGAYTGTDGGETAAGDTDHYHGFSSWGEMQTTMDERSLRFITENKGEFGGRPREWTMSDDGYKV